MRLRSVPQYILAETLMLVRKGKGEKKERGLCQTSFCISFVSTVNSLAKSWRCVQAGLPEKKDWRARTGSTFDSSRGKQRTEWELGTRLESGSVKLGSRAKVIASFCNSHLVIQVESVEMWYWCLCVMHPKFHPVCANNPQFTLTVGWVSRFEASECQRVKVSCRCGGDLEECGGTSWEFKV